LSFTDALGRSPKPAGAAQRAGQKTGFADHEVDPMPLSSVIITAVLTAASSARAAPASPPQPSLRLEPYDFKLADGASLAVQRGRLLVPEDRTDPKSRKIEIGFIRFPTTSADPGPPIVYLAGGPGGSGVSAARGARQPIFLELRKVADVIALDQRGTGFSNHIPPCTADRRLDPVKILSEATLTRYYADTLRVCLGRWTGAGVAVRGYTTVQSADDIEDLRRALGARQVDLWGISYGTHLAMAAMRRHPASIRRVALASAEGMDQTVKLPSNLEPVYGRIDAAAGGGLADRMRRVHARFDAEPQTFTGVSKAGARFSFRTDSFVFRLIASSLPKNPNGIPALVQTYAALETGQTDELAAALYEDSYAKPLTLRGMGELMDIASGISGARLAQFRKQAPGGLSGAGHNFPMPQLRGAVSGLDLGDAFRREVATNHPVLLLSGDLDVRTPIEEQAAATSGLSGLHQVVVRNGGHDLFEAHPAVPELLSDFFLGRPITTRLLLLPAPKAARR
jgi:pimeloyl-ACP methyl ester carboxylesterase